jgi:DNA-directed RNA polymerase specialized sigma subunit
MKRTIGKRCKCGCTNRVPYAGESTPAYIQGHQPEPEQKLIHRIAWSFANTTGIDVQELYQEAIVAYYRALETYDSNQNTKLTSHCWTYMKNALTNYARNEQRTTARFAENFEPEDPISTRNERFNDMLNSMSNDAQNVCEMILEDPDEFSERGSLKQVKNTLRDLNWTWPEIWKTVKEVRQSLQQLT